MSDVCCLFKLLNAHNFLFECQSLKDTHYEPGVGRTEKKEEQMAK